MPTDTNTILDAWKAAISDVDRHGSALAAALKRCERIRADAERMPYADQPLPRLQRPLGRATVVDLAALHGFDAMNAWRHEAIRAGWLEPTKQQARDLAAEERAAAALAKRHEKGVRESLERAREALVIAGRIG